VRATIAIRRRVTLHRSMGGSLVPVWLDSLPLNAVSSFSFVAVRFRQGWWLETDHQLQKLLDVSFRNNFEPKSESLHTLTLTIKALLRTRSAELVAANA
jgi:hypothetical protein